MLVVTGPGGNVGAELAEILVRTADPATYRLVSRRPEQLRTRHGAGTPVAALDFADRSTWPAALQGVTTLFLLFPLPSPRAARTTMVPFVQAAVAAGCTHIVYVSVPGADRQRLVPHHAVEQAIRASGAAWTVLRPSFFGQNLHRAISTQGVDIVERGEVFVPAGDGVTTFVDSRDVGEVAAMVATHPGEHAGESYVLTGPDTLSFYDVADVLTDVLDRPIRYAKPSLPRFCWRLRRRGVSWDTVGFMCGVYSLTRFGRNSPDSDELPRLLGRPARGFRAFAEESRWRWEQRAWS